jgi:AcrR family transcriptional regulator
MGIAERAVERSVEKARSRGEQDVDAFLEAGIAVLRRRGVAGLTVAEVLAEARRSTRAFYRHFASKDEFVLAIYEHEARASLARLHERMARVSNGHAALVAWIDAILMLGYAEARARRTGVLAGEARRLRGELAEEFSGIVRAQLEPLVAALHQGRGDGTFPNTDPEADAGSIYAVVWALVEERLHGGGFPTLAEARAHVLRFCLPALGARP